DFHVTGVQTCALPIYKQQVYQFGYQLLFGLDRNEFVKVIFIKPLKSGKHKAFMWQQEYTQGRYIPIEIGTEYNQKRFSVAVVLQIGRASCRERVWSWG